MADLMPGLIASEPYTAVVVPSRGRPIQLRDMLDAVYQTSAGLISVLVGLDLDDEADYAALVEPRMHTYPGLAVIRGPRRSLSAWTNDLARNALSAAHPPTYLVSMGDDHRPRTAAWDLCLRSAIDALPGRTGFAYGNDLFQGERLPTAWMASAAAVRDLGWMMLPECSHMYVDQVIRDVGKSAERLAYRSDVIIEHLHPLAQKAAWDPTYRETNNDAVYTADGRSYQLWLESGGLSAAVSALTGAAR
jgi:hypothetical protein